MKKIITIILSILLILILCLSLCSCSQSVSPIEDFEYEFNDGTVTITGYTGTDLEIVIPDTIEERPVTVIGKHAFSEYDMTSIVLPDTVTAIEYGAFDYCKLLEKIDIPDSVTHISSEAFRGCENLKEVNLGKGLTKISGGAFEGCSLKSIHIPDNVTYFDCFINDVIFDRSCTIYGKSSSAAEKYAKEKGVAFVAE